jgi:hypothetical protein
MGIAIEGVRIDAASGKAGAGAGSGAAETGV